MGNEDVFRLLKVKKEVCTRDLAEEFGITIPHANRLLNNALKYDNVDYKFIIINKGYRRFVVKYIFLSES